MQPENKEQHFKAVKASEKPKKEREYFVFAEQKLTGEKQTGKTWYKNGEWVDDNEYWHVTHYLEPIQLPDAAVLRAALSEVRHHIDTWTDEPDRAVRLAAKVIDKALSQTADGWIPIDEKKPEPGEFVFVMTKSFLPIEEIFLVQYIDMDTGCFGHGSVLYWIPRTALPSPPKPLNKECTCSDYYRAAHGLCYNCPFKSLKERNDYYKAKP